MYPRGYTAEVTSLSPRATEKDLHDFFSCWGLIDYCRSHQASVIVDQCVSISCWGAYIDECDNWSNHTSKPEGSTRSMDIHVEKMVSTPGEAVSMVQEVVKTMVAKGYVLGKDALVKAKAFDESYNVSSRAAAKGAKLSNKIGLSDTIYEGMETFKNVDEKYHITGTAAIVLATVTRRAAVATGTAVVNSTLQRELSGFRIC